MHYSKGHRSREVYQLQKFLSESEAKQLRAQLFTKGKRVNDTRAFQIEGDSWVNECKPTANLLPLEEYQKRAIFKGKYRVQKFSLTEDFVLRSVTVYEFEIGGE